MRSIPYFRSWRPGSNARRRTTAAVRPAARLNLEYLEDRAVPAFAFSWAFRFGGPNLDVGHNIAIDAAGGVYVTGRFEGTVNFDATHSLTAMNARDAFVAKFDSTGTCQWVNNLGANYFGKSSVVVQGTSVYVAWPGAVWNGAALVRNGSLHVAQFAASSGTTGWQAQLSDDGTPPFYTPWMNVGIAVGPSSGDVYVGGSSYGTGASQAVVARLNPSTGVAVWTSVASPGPSSTCFATGLGLDSAENVYVSGTYTGTANFNPDPGTTTTLSSVSGSSDAFVWKLTSGGAYVWAGSMGGTGVDYADSIAVDGMGRVNVIGLWNANGPATPPVDFDPGPGTLPLTNQGDFDVFVVHLVSTDGGQSYTAQANAGGWAKNIGGPGQDVGWGVSVDDSGAVYSIGIFSGVMSLSEFAPSGTAIATYSIVGASAGVSVCIDVFANVYATGSMTGTANFNPDPSTPPYNLTSAGDADPFVLKLTQPKPPTAVATVNGGAIQRSMVTNITVTFSTAVTLDPGALSLQRADGVTIALNPSVSILNGQTVAVLTFSGSGVFAGSLDDGLYTLTVNSAQVRDQFGNTLDGNGDGIAGDNYALALHRLFGDADGDRTVNAADLNLFRSVFGATAIDPTFDMNRDGVINVADLNLFRANFGSRL